MTIATVDGVEKISGREADWLRVKSLLREARDLESRARDLVMIAKQSKHELDLLGWWYQIFKPLVFKIVGDAPKVCGRYQNCGLTETDRRFLESSVAYDAAYFTIYNILRGSSE